MKVLGISVEWLGHDSFRLKAEDKTIYIDPFNLRGAEKADLILVTHGHFDHCSIEDIKKISAGKTTLICDLHSASKIEKTGACSRILKIETGQEIETSGIRVKAVPAYNLEKQFHPIGLGVGYLVELAGVRVYHAGDTDFIPEMNELKGIVDIALLPVSGTYVMNASEAVKAAEEIQPKIAIPMHYGSIIGSRKDAEEFEKQFTGKTIVLEREE